MTGISALIKRLQKAPFPFLPCKNTANSVYEGRSGFPADMDLILDFLASETMRKKFLLCISHLVYGIFVMAA